MQRFEKEIRDVNNLVGELTEGTPVNLYDASRHISLAGGKRIRPIMCILSCEASGGNRDDALQTATAIELIHTFTLVHDDIMDNDEMRRGRPAVHVVYGMPTAILAGDLLYAKAFEVCDPRTTRVLARASTEICEGQELDMSFEERIDVSENEYMEMIRKKTAVLLEASMRSGAIIAEAPSDITENISSFGMNLGMAFQVQDDILGLTADEAKLGKPVGSDIVEGKKNLLIIKALENLVDGKRNELFSLMGKGGTPEQMKCAIDLVESSGAFEYCKEKAESFITDAMDALDRIPDSTARSELREVAEFVVKRDL